MIRRWGPAAAVVAAVLLASALGIVRFRQWRHDEAARRVLADPFLSDGEKLRKLRKNRYRSEDVFRERDRVADQLLARLAREGAAAADPESADQAAAEAASHAPFVGSKGDDFRALADRTAGRAQEMRAARIRALAENPQREEDLQEGALLLRDFQRRYPGSPTLRELEPLVRRFDEIRMSEDWRRLRGQPRATPRDFRAMAEGIREFVRRFPTHAARAELEIVAEVCRLFSEKRQYRLRIRSSETAGESYDQVLEVWIVDQKIQLRAPDATPLKTWAEERSFAWQPGEGIEVKLFDADPIRWDLLARKRRTDGTAIGLLTGELALEKVEQEGCKAVFEVLELPRSSWLLYEKYLGP